MAKRGRPPKKNVEKAANEDKVVQTTAIRNPAPEGVETRYATVTKVTTTVTEETITKRTVPNDVRETCITHCSGDGFIDFYSSEVWGKNFAKKMLAEHPEDCKLNYEDPDGYSISITMPFESMKYIRYPSKRSLSEEQIEALRERSKKMQEVRMANIQARKAKAAENSGEDVGEEDSTPSEDDDALLEDEDTSYVEEDDVGDSGEEPTVEE